MALSEFLEHERINNTGKPLASYGVNPQRSGEIGLEAMTARFNNLKKGMDPGDIGGPDKNLTQPTSSIAYSPEESARYIANPVTTISIGNSTPITKPGYKLASSPVRPLSIKPNQNLGVLNRKNYSSRRK